MLLIKVVKCAGLNPLFGRLKSTISVFGTTSHIWVEEEGMLHALYFDKKTVTGVGLLSTTTNTFKQKHSN